ncbi:hypothetical protein STANM337S_06534 [Streptomyces tanashiensis]
MWANTLLHCHAVPSVSRSRCCAPRTAHRPRLLSGRMPLEEWRADSALVTDVLPWTCGPFALEGDDGPRKLTGHGVWWRGRVCIAAWMTCRAGPAGMVRCMPHHDHESDVCAACGGCLRRARFADGTGPINSGSCARPVRSVSDVCAPRGMLLRRCPRLVLPRPPRPGPAQRLGPFTFAHAGRELAAVEHTDVSDPVLPDLLRRPPPARWRTAWSCSRAARRRVVAGAGCSGRGVREVWVDQVRISSAGSTRVARLAWGVSGRSSARSGCAGTSVRPVRGGGVPPPRGMLSGGCSFQIRSPSEARSSKGPDATAPVRPRAVGSGSVAGVDAVRRRCGAGYVAAADEHVGEGVCGAGSCPRCRRYALRTRSRWAGAAPPGARRPGSPARGPGI